MSIVAFGVDQLNATYTPDKPVIGPVAIISHLLLRLGRSTNLSNMRLQLHSSSGCKAPSTSCRSRRVNVQAALPAAANGGSSSTRQQATSSAVALLSAAVMASAALLGPAVAPVVAAEEAATQTVVEGPFKGRSGE